MSRETVPSFTLTSERGEQRVSSGHHFQTVNLAPALADVIARLHNNKSLAGLLVRA